MASEQLSGNKSGVPEITVSSLAEVKSKIDEAISLLSNSQEDWTKRMNQLKTIRSIVLHVEEVEKKKEMEQLIKEKVIGREQLIGQLIRLTDCLALSITDRRSQLSKEAAVTCSFLIQRYGNEVRLIAEQCMPSAFDLLRRKSEKVTVTSGATLTMFIVQYVHTKKIFTDITSYATSKNENQRRQVCNLLEVVIENWNEKIKKELMPKIRELIKAAISDPDQETRAGGRKVFSKLEATHPEEAKEFFASLESSEKRKLLPTTDAASSSTSINSEQGTTPFRSKLSVASDGGIKNKPKSKFLAQKSASAIDTKLLDPITPNNKPIGRNADRQTMSVNKHVDRMAEHRHSFSLRLPSTTSLLPAEKERVKPKTPQKSAVDIEAVLRACSSDIPNEKAEGIRKLSSIVSKPTLNPLEIEEIGDVLNRLLGEATNTVVLESVELFVTTHHDRLTEWLKPGLEKMLAKKDSEMMQDMKKQMSTTMNCIMSSFDPNLQFRVTCELMCHRSYSLASKARIARIEYLNDLVEKHMERGITLNTKEVKATLLEMFSWMNDERIGSKISPHGEKLLCSLFDLNAADCSALFSEFNPDYRDSAYRILQSHGHNQHAPPSEVVSNGDDINKRVDVKPLRPLSSEMNSQRRDEEINLNESFDRLKLSSTVHLIDDVAEQSKFVSAKLDQISEHSGTQQFEGLLSIQTMLCEGSFTLWEQNFAKLLTAVFDVLSKDGDVANKRVALRVLTKMCTSQASRLFNSTEIAVCNVLDAAVNCVDGTMNAEACKCLKTLAAHLPLAKIVSITKEISNQENVQEAKAGLVLEMMTCLFERLQADELSPVIGELAPCATRAYDSPSSAVEAQAAKCLVAMVNKLGMKTMGPHLQHLSSEKRYLVQVYVNRAMSSSSHSQV